MRTTYKLAMTALFAVAVQSRAAAQVQFYNGDLNHINGLSSESNTAVPFSMAYENFTVSGGGLFVTGLFGQYAATAVWTTAYWEVRSGVSSGNGGSLLFSGADPATRVFLGVYGPNPDYDVYSVSVTGLSFFLAPGEYWFGLSPIGTGFGQAFLGLTSGSNGVNANPDGHYFFDSDSFGADFVANVIGNGDFSLGVEGRLAESAVPEPATMTLLATGLAGLAGARRRNRTKA